MYVNPEMLRGKAHQKLKAVLSLLEENFELYKQVYVSAILCLIFFFHLVHLSLTSVNDYLCPVVAGETNARGSCSGHILLEPSNLECGKDGGVIASHDVRGAPIGGIDDARARVGPPQDTVTVRGNVDTNLRNKAKEKREKRDEIK